MFQLILFLGLLSIGIQQISSTCVAEIKHYCIHHCYDKRETDINCLNTTLTENYLSVHGDISYLSETKNITFKYSIIPVIPNSLFAKCRSVENLYINDSHVQTIKSGAFHELTNLITLYLQDNQITSFKSGTFEDLKSLQILNISNNHLMSLDEDIFEDLISLQILDISCNNLTTLDTKLFKKTRYISELYLSNNNIDTKNEINFNYLNDLQIVDLENNNLHNFSALHFNYAVITLNTFKIGNNMMCFNENSMYTKFNNVQKLTLSHNKIQVNIVFSESVTYLDVSFTMLPLSVSSFENCKILKELLINNNNIAIIDVDIFASLSELINLQLQFNNIQNIPIGSFRNLHKLQILNLSHNSLDHLEFGTINGLVNLEILNLANNQLLSVEVREFYSLRYIKMIYLDNNLLSTLDIQKIFGHMHRNISEPITISLNNNHWKCDWLPEAIGLLQKNNFIVLRGDTFKFNNFNGIACTDNKTNNLISYTSANNAPIQPTKPSTKLVNTTPTTKMEIILSTTTERPTRTRKMYTVGEVGTTKKQYVISDLPTFVNANTERPVKTNIDYKYFDKYFSSYNKANVKDKSEEIWQVVSELKNLQIFITIVLVLMLSFIIIYIVHMKIVTNKKRDLQVNNELYSQSCNIELIDSTNE